MTYINANDCTSYEIGHTYIQLNGENVTMRCFEADDKAGYVGLYRLNEHGQKFLDDDEAAKERLEGKVSILIMPQEATEPCADEVTLETVAFFPPTQKETMACYRCGYWAVEVTTPANEFRTFVHAEAIGRK
jgi:hypothetical protein